MTASDLLARSRSGARKILLDCLSLRQGDVLTVFHDETTRGPVKTILREARYLGLLVRDHFVPVSYQRSFSGASTNSLDSEDLEAIAGARAILTCLSSDPASTAYRLELVRSGTGPGRRLGHMPGVTLSLLSNAVNIDYDLASSRCDDLSLAMSRGRFGRLRTWQFSKRGRCLRQFDLEFDLGGPGRSALSSTGIIPLGTWGNLPGGETFIAPMEGTAQGTFALNGAFRGAVLSRGELLLLNFEAGKLHSIEGPAIHRRKLEYFLSLGRDHGNDGFDAVAELGVGVNGGLARLTGNSLLDEKCAGTAHIALGDNTRYGGRIYSHIHEDLVTRRPSLWIDDKPILEVGQFAFRTEHWRETLEASEPIPEFLNDLLLIRRTSLDAEVSTDGTLHVRQEVAAGRICTYTIGDRATSRTLAHLFARIPTFPQQGKVTELTQWAEDQSGLSPAKAHNALAILLNHGVIEMRQPAV